MTKVQITVKNDPHIDFIANPVPSLPYQINLDLTRSNNDSSTSYNMIDLIKAQNSQSQVDANI